MSAQADEQEPVGAARRGDERAFTRLMDSIVAGCTPTVWSLHPRAVDEANAQTLPEPVAGAA